MNQKVSDYNHSIIKRVFDLCIAFILIVATAPLLFFIIVVYFFLIRKYPIFFKQERVGTNGETILVYKIRTIHGLKYSSVPIQNAVHKISKFIRTTHLDEIPQCINVINGEMSIVGPRPYTLDETLILDNKIAGFSTRTLIKPGLTGLAQLDYDHDNSIASAEKKYQWDIHYVETASFLTDCKIVFMTAVEMTRFRGI